MKAPMQVQGLHHFAYKCRDAEQTRHFWEDIVGLPLAHCFHITGHKPTTGGAPVDYMHLFFEMGDGSYIAFFDLDDGQISAPSPNTAAWVNHIALQVASVDELEAARKHLVAHGIEVAGPLDHGIVKSIYFFDPNGLRGEFTTRTCSREHDAEAKARAHDQLADWQRQKRHAARPAAPVPA